MKRKPPTPKNPFCPAAAQIILALWPGMSALQASKVLGVSQSTFQVKAKAAGLIAKGRKYKRGLHPCGAQGCPAAVRVAMVIPDLPTVHRARMIGVSWHALTRWAEERGIPGLEVTKRLDRRIPAAVIRKAWLDPETPAYVSAQRLGIADRTLYHRAMDLGLPIRKDGPAPAPWPKDFEDMWHAGVTCAEMAAAAGRKAPSHITHEAKRRGLPPRRPGRGIRKTIDQYREERLSRAMARSAAVEQVNIITAGMADRSAGGGGNHTLRLTGARHVVRILGGDHGQAVTPR